MFMLAGALFGCAATMGNICYSVLLPQLFGVEHQGAIQGATMTGMLIYTDAMLAIDPYPTKGPRSFSSLNSR